MKGNNFSRGHACRVCGLGWPSPVVCDWVERNLCSVCAGQAPRAALQHAERYARERGAARRLARRWAAAYAAWGSVLVLAWVLS